MRRREGCLSFSTPIDSGFFSGHGGKASRRIEAFAPPQRLTRCRSLAVLALAAREREQQDQDQEHDPAAAIRIPASVNFMNVTQSVRLSGFVWLAAVNEKAGARKP
jgi:hypothetical protein